MNPIRAIISDTWAWFRLQMRYNASRNTAGDRGKSRFLLLRESHTFEKALSLRNPRKGFGTARAEALLDSLERYESRFGSDEDSTRAASILKRYFQYCAGTGVDASPLAARLDTILKGREVPVAPGVLNLRAADADGRGKPFGELLACRHSIRYFKQAEVPRELIQEALQMASRTPSACNRQAWRTRVFKGGKAQELLRWQGGCKGFEDEMPAAILVSADLRAFLYYEQRQAYVDGGMYAQNLLNALHSLGLGTIPLSCGFLDGKLKGLAAFGLPRNEVPIAIIGCGYPEDEFRVACSDRQDISRTNTFCE